MTNQREAFNKFCFTADITPSTEHLDIWKAAQSALLEDADKEVNNRYNDHPCSRAAELRRKV